MSGQWCPDCGRWLMASHTCPPRWQVTCFDTDDTHVVYAVNASDAAEQWALHADTEEAGYIAGGGSVVTVEVRPMADLSLPPQRFTVRGEMEPEYFTEPVCGTCDGAGVVEHIPHMGTMACDPADVRETACPDCDGAA